MKNTSNLKKKKINNPAKNLQKLKSPSNLKLIITSKHSLLFLTKHQKFPPLTL